MKNKSGKTYFFEFESSLSDFGHIQATTQPIKMLEDIRGQFPKQVSITSEEVIDNKKILIRGVVASQVETAKLHNKFKEIFISNDKESQFISRWKDISELSFDLEHKD